MGVESQSRRPLRTVHISPPRPHGPMGACTHGSTKVQVARARTSTGQHSTRTPRARGSQDATPAPLLGASSGMRAMARGAVSADPRGSCHQPRRYHVSPAKWLRRPIFRGRTRHAVDLESSCFSLYKCTRFDIFAVFYTCTTVASRVAANARALTHARRSLWHRRLTHHTHTSTHLNVPNLGILNAHLTYGGEHPKVNSTNNPTNVDADPPRSLVRDGQTHPHRPRLVVSHSTCPPLSSSPHAHSFVIGPAVIKHTH
jgi:hypothetical protein